jgi:hypothetical protein
MATARRANRKSAARDSGAIELPSVRAFRIWSPQLLLQAERSADTGSIRLAVDLCDWLLGDDKVRGSLDGRVNAVFGSPLTFEASGDGRRRSRTVRALEADEDYEAIYPEPEAIQVMYWGILLGAGPGVFRYRQLEGHGGRDIPVLEFFHPQPLSFDWTQRTWMRALSNGTSEPIEFGDGTWLGHMPFGHFRPWSMGLWRAIARWVLLKQYAIADWGRLGESASRNVIESDKDVKATKELRKELADDISAMARDSSIVLPAGFSYKLVEASAVTKDLYNQQIKAADEAIAITIRGGNLTTNVQGGSRSAAEVQERRGDEANAKRDAVAWATTAHDQGLVYWAGDNYGDQNLAPYPVYKTEPEEDRQAAAEVFTAAIGGAQQAEALGFELDREAFANRFGLADFLKPGTPKQPPAPTPPGGTPAPNQGQEKKPAGRARRLVALASGAAAKENRGFLEGQLYVDTVVEKASEVAGEVLQPTLDAILEELEAAADFNDLRERLRRRYEQLSAEDLTELVYRAMLIGDLAGRAAVTQDT